MDELQDYPLNHPFPIIFLGNLYDSLNYLSAFINNINVRISTPNKALSPHDVVRPLKDDHVYDHLRRLAISRIAIEPMQDQDVSARFKFHTFFKGDHEKTTTMHLAGILKLTALTSEKTRVEYHEISSDKRVDLRLIWQEFLRLLEQDQLLQTLSPHRRVKPDRPSWFPKGEVTLGRWKAAWTVICSTQEDYLNDYSELKVEDPEPTLTNLRDAIATKIGKRYSDSSIKKIKRAGDAGWLE